MAEAQVNFYLQRLESLLLHEADILAGLVDHLQSIRASLKQISDFFGCTGNSDSHSWVNDLNELVSSLDDQVDEFIIQIDKQTEPDRLALTDYFKIELQKIQSHLAEIVHRITHPTMPTPIDTDAKEAITDQSSDPFNMKYKNLPYYLKSLLLYCCIFPENHWIAKGKLIWLLVAEGLTIENTGKILEDVAEQNINELISQGMLEIKDEHPRNGTKLTVSSPYRLILQENFTIAQAGSEVNIPVSLVVF